MAETPLETFLPGVRPDAWDTVSALAAAVDAAGVAFDSKITWKMLVFTLDARWRDWVVAIGVSKSVVNLRFLHGDRLEDPAGLLRAGSSTLMTLDFATPREVDAAVVTAYVREAAARHPGRS